MGNEVKNEVAAQKQKAIPFILSKLWNISFNNHQKDSELAKHPELKKLVNLSACTCKKIVFEFL